MDKPINEKDKYNFFLVIKCLACLIVTLTIMFTYIQKEKEKFWQRSRELCKPGVVEKIVDNKEDVVILFCTDGENKWLKKQTR